MKHTITRWLTRGLCRPLLACGATAAGSFAFAQSEPAARLLPARAVDRPATVVRGAAPTAPPYQFRPPTAVPAPGVKPPPASPPRPTLFDNMAGGVKAVFAQTPAEARSDKALWPASQANAPQPVSPPPAPPPGVYAGPPAYRWYGYGSPTAGANPYAPTGRYPRGSESWYSRTGATPGAFPIPIGGVPVTPNEPPVVVQTVPQETNHPPIDPPVPPQFRPPTRMAEMPWPAPDARPVMPAGSGERVSIPLSAPPEVNWQAVSDGSRVPIATSGETRGGQPTPTTNQTEWGPAKRSVPGSDAPLPAVPTLPDVTLIRGQAPVTEQDLDALIRLACFGRATRVKIEHTGPGQFRVTVVAPTEADARDAAALVSRLPEVKPYTVTFEAVVEK